MRTLTLYLSLFMLLTACRPGESPAPGVAQPSPTAAEALPLDVLSPQPTPALSTDRSLVIWVPEPLAPGSEPPGADALAGLVERFDAAHPDVQLILEVKRVVGPGGMLAYLRTAPAVAPGVVPDLLLLDVDSLLAASSEGLIVPFEGAQVGVEALYPAARGMGTLNGQLYGLAFVLDAQHVVYDAAVFPAGVPRRLDDLRASPVPYVFPAGRLEEVSRTVLLHYQAAGGRLIDEAGAPVLDREPLTALLTAYAGARQANVLTDNLFNLFDLSETWALYRDGAASLAETTSYDYLRGRSGALTTAFAATPTLSGEPFTLVGGWMWAAPTREDGLTDEAAQFLAFVDDPGLQGEYTLTAGWLPARPDALQTWPEADPYVDFAAALLQVGQPLLPNAVRSVPSAALQTAVEEVLLEGAVPAQAAARAAEAVRSEQLGGR